MVFQILVSPLPAPHNLPAFIYSSESMHSVHLVGQTGYSVPAPYPELKLASWTYFFSSTQGEGLALLFPFSSGVQCLASEPYEGIAFPLQILLLYGGIHLDLLPYLPSWLYLLPSVFKPRDDACFNVLHSSLDSTFLSCFFPLRIFLISMWIRLCIEKVFQYFV